MEKTCITVIIPTLNGGKAFRLLLEQLALQSVKIDELIVIDSSSDDETALLAEKFGAKVTIIPRRDFDHGRTRSLAAKKSSGDFIIFFTQDAVPDSSNVIKNLLNPLIQDKTVALSYGRQLPYHTATVFAAALRLFNYPAVSEKREFSDRTKRGLRTVFISNSCAAYRKRCLQEVDYFSEGLIFGEDTCVAGKLLSRGYKMAYVAEAAVFHSHNYSIISEFRRSFDIGVLHRTESWLLETYGRAEGEGLKYIKFELSTLMKSGKWYLLPIFICRNFAKYSGYKLGSKYLLLPKWLLPRLSMNKTWWRRQG